MSKIFATIMLSIIITGCSTLDIKIDYDREFDFNSLSKFTVLYSKKNDSKDFTRTRINKIITKYFQNLAYLSTPKKDADFYILFHLDIKTRTEVETTYETMMIRPRAYYAKRGTANIYKSPYLFPLLFTDSITTSKTNTYEYEEGRLNIEIFDIKSNTIVFQALVKDDIDEIKTSEQIEKIIDRVFRSFKAP